MQRDDSEEDEYALSENWTFEQSNRRWSRVGDQMAADIASSHFIAGVGGGGGSSTNSDGGTTTATTATGGTKSAGSRDSSTEKLLADEHHKHQQQLLLSERSPQHAGRPNDGDLSAMGAGDAGDASTLPVRFRRTGSERLKDGAKALLRRVESIKSRRRKRQNRDGMCCELPAELDLSVLQSGGPDARITMARSQPPSPLPGSPLRLQPSDFGGAPHRLSPLNYATLGVSGARKSNTLQPQSLSNRTSPLHFFQHHHHPLLVSGGGGVSADESSSYYSDASQESSSAAVAGQPKKRPSRTRRFLLKGGGGRVEDGGVMSDSECQLRTTPLVTAVVTQPSPTGEQPTSTAAAAAVKLQRGGSLNLGKDGQKERRSGLKSRSFRSRSSCRKAGGDGGWSSSGYGEGDGDAMSGGGGKSGKAVVLRWHSFQSHAQRTAAQAQKTASMPAEFMFRKFGAAAVGATAGSVAGMGLECGGMAELAGEPQRATEGMPLAAMSCGQIQVRITKLQK